MPLKDVYPADATARLSPEYGTRLGDHLPNAERLCIVSSRLRALLEAALPREAVEFLPLRLLSPRGSEVARYSILNLLGGVACLDRKRSDFVPDTDRPGRVLMLTKLRLDARKIPEPTLAFRLAEYPTLVLVREDLGRRILRAGCTSVAFQAADRWR